MAPYVGSLTPPAHVEEPRQAAAMWDRTWRGAWHVLTDHELRLAQVEARWRQGLADQHQAELWDP